MKFVALDGFLANFDNIGLQIGQHEQVWHHTTAPEQTIERIGDAEGVLVNRVLITREVINACPNIRYIGTFGTGYNMIDLQAAKERGITICNVPAYGTDAVAQHTIALLLEIVARVGDFNELVHSGRWLKEDSPEVVAIRTYEVAGKTLGVYGAGNIGRKVAHIAAALGMNVLAYDKFPSTAPADAFIRYVDTDTLLTSSDVVTIHAPLNDESRRFFSKETIAKMKTGAILLNAARGAIVDEDAVVEALNSGKLWALGTDVMSTEPPSAENRIYNHPRVVVTPHVAWMPRETRERLLGVVSENILAFLDGKPQNIVGL